MKAIKNRFFILLVILAGCTGLVANGLNLNSNGSKAIAMGGAFVGLADDYSAAFWNPAGLIQLDTSQISLFGTDVIPNATYQYEMAGIDATSMSKHYISGAAGFFTPLGDRMVAGIYAYVPSGLGVEWDGADLAPLAGGNANANWKSLFAVVTLSPAISFQISDSLSIGATVNINYGMLKLEQPALGQYEESLNGLSVGATAGLLFRPSDQFSIGFTVKTPSKATLSGDASMSGAGLAGLPTSDTAEREASLPLWLAGGIAFRPTDNLTITADIQYTNWAALDSIPVSYDNPYWEAVFAQGSEIDLQWEDAVQLRFGLEYQLSSCLALRGGYYYDPNPSPLETLSILLPEASYNWITLGVGFQKGSISLDVAFEYGMGKEVTIEAGEGTMPGTHGMNIMVPNIALTWHLD